MFHKCAESIEEGKRLENLTWRLWNRETFCCDSQPQINRTPSFSLTGPNPSERDIPDLSASVSSVGSDEAARAERRRPVEEQSPLSRSRGREKHITSQRLEQLVISIKEKQVPEPLSPSIENNLSHMADETPRPSSPHTRARDLSDSSERQSNHSADSQYTAETVDSESSAMPGCHPGSDTSVSSAIITQSPTIVHGFSPSVHSTSFKSRPSVTSQDKQILEPAPKSEPKKKETKFIIGNGSVSEEDSSFEDRLLLNPKFSSLSQGLQKSTSSQAPVKKQASFREIMDSRPMDSEDAIESDDESEGALDEDDDSSWEDSDNEEPPSSVEEKPMFQRVDSRPNLTSRRSLLTTALTQGDRAEALQRAAMAAQSSPNLRRSRRSSPNGPSVPGSPEEESGLTMRGPERAPDVQRSKPIIVTTSNTHPPAHSPRTTRRNMLSTELPESLRRHLLWERQPRGGTANAIFRRSHTTQNMGTLQNQAGDRGDHDTSRNNSWNNYFDYGPSEYHATGW